MDRRRKEMKLNNLSAKKICRLISAGMVFSMLVITGILGGIMQDIRIFIAGGTLTLCAFFWIWLLVLFFGKRLSHFTSNLCRTLDNMIDGNEELQKSNDSETLFARINHRLIRLYEIMQENRHKVDMERQELQMLISDISHQVKTPVSNLQMVTDTLLTKPVSEEERMDFLQGIRSQTDKLDFLFQALVKTSRLETGAIRLEKKDSSLFHTLAQAMSSIVYAAEKKEIAVSVDCPENLIISHDSKWTSEALFNLLDNAVKYTPSGGKISVSVVQWEMYVEVKVTDTGRGISESNQAAIFRRFYREEEVHDQQGVGIGLYLAREIVTRQGGYIKVVSELGQGSEFSIMLPVR
jgi:signal transduction histidine kinase